MIETTDDKLLDGRVILRQPVKGYRAAVDPVLLAAAVKPAYGHRVLDAGCGTGAAALCLAARLPHAVITGLEIQGAYARLARENAVLNHMQDRVRIVEGDLAAPPDLGAPFDVAITNPPFGADGTPPADAGLATAHMESHLALGPWIKACLALIRSNGRLVVIHRADRVSALLAALAPGCGDIHVLPVLPKPGEPARRVIVDAGKGRRTPDTLLAGFVLHRDDGRFTAAADAVLRGGPL
ncbi:MAG: methyltransferase [Rhodospirillaceae bacterium]|nr:methyltransferase [Rhodospirillaceae bacterium]